MYVFCLNQTWDGEDPGIYKIYIITDGVNFSVIRNSIDERKKDIINEVVDEIEKLSKRRLNGDFKLYVLSLVEGLG